MSTLLRWWGSMMTVIMVVVAVVVVAVVVAAVVVVFGGGDGDGKEGRKGRKGASSSVSFRGRSTPMRKRWGSFLNSSGGVLSRTANRRRCSTNWN